jgi:hypothetical protein
MVPGSLAQLVEQLTLNQRVEGSSPSRSTNRRSHRSGFLLYGDQRASSHPRHEANPAYTLVNIFQAAMSMTPARTRHRIIPLNFLDPR